MRLVLQRVLHGKVSVDGQAVEMKLERGFVQVRMRNIRTMSLSDHRFRAEDDVDRATLDERSMQYMYRDGASFHFMDQETYETLTLGPAMLGDALDFLVDGQAIQVQTFNGSPIGVQLPVQVELTVRETEAGARGDTASGNVTKRATLETGLEIRVPLFIKEGEKVRVSTETREFAGRA